MFRTFQFYSYLFGCLVVNIPKFRRAEKWSKEGKQREAYQLIDSVVDPKMKRLLKIAGADVTITGTHQLSPNETYLFVGNHQSNFDTPLLYTSSPVKMAFMAKKEMEKIPLLSYDMKLRGMVFLDRKNPRNAVIGINQGIELLKQGHSVAIFPEGTRNKGGDMRPFKAGGLKLALKSNAKVVPVTIKNSHSLMESNGGWVKPAAVQVVFGTPLDVSSYKDAIELANDLQSIIQTELKA